jgi:hypothetical protein
MNHDQSRDAASQQKRGRHECGAQRAPWIEAAVAAKRDCDIPLKPSRIPASQAAPDRQNHRHLKQATAPRSGEASRGKNLRQQKYRHSKLPAIRNIASVQIQKSGCFYYPPYPDNPHPKTLDMCLK